MRCCKDLGIGGEMWDPKFIHEWKESFTERVWCVNEKTSEKRILWRKKNQRGLFQYPWKEQGVAQPQGSQNKPVAPAQSYATESNPPPAQPRAQPRAAPPPQQQTYSNHNQAPPPPGAQPSAPPPYAPQAHAPPPPQAYAPQAGQAPPPYAAQGQAPPPYASQGHNPPPPQKPAYAGAPPPPGAPPTPTQPKTKVFTPPPMQDINLDEVIDESLTGGTEFEGTYIFHFYEYCS
jgi:hypothetical protein